MTVKLKRNYNDSEISLQLLRASCKTLKKPTLKTTGVAQELTEDDCMADTVYWVTACGLENYFSTGK